MQLFNRGRLEAESAVKRSGFLVFGMNGHRSNTGDLGHNHCALHRVFDEATAQALTLPMEAYCHASKNHQWNRVTRQSFGKPRWGVLISNRPHNECVISNHFVFGKQEIGLGRARQLIGQCELSKKFIK